MIRLPLDAYGFRAPSERPDVVVELDEETRASVRLIFELEPREIVGSTKPYAEFTDDDGIALASSVDEDPNVVRIRELEAELEQAKRTLELRTDHRDHLLERLEQAAAERSIERELLPHEARALASMLWHYATEAEAR